MTASAYIEGYFYELMKFMLKYKRSNERVYLNSVARPSILKLYNNIPPSSKAEKAEAKKFIAWIDNRNSELVKKLPSTTSFESCFLSAGQFRKAIAASKEFLFVKSGNFKSRKLDNIATLYNFLFIHQHIKPEIGLQEFTKALAAYFNRPLPFRKMGIGKILPELTIQLEQFYL